MDTRERPGPLHQVLVARVDVGLHRERGVVMPRPPADDGDRNACLFHQGQSRVPGVVQPDLAQPGALEQAAELVGVPLGVDRDAQFVGDDVFIAGGVPVEIVESSPVAAARLLAFPSLPLCADRSAP
jgi:hypothetical protein